MAELKTKPMIRWHSQKSIRTRSCRTLTRRTAAVLFDDKICVVLMNVHVPQLVRHWTGSQTVGKVLFLTNVFWLRWGLYLELFAKKWLRWGLYLAIKWNINILKWGRGSEVPAAHTQQKLTQFPHPGIFSLSGKAQGNLSPNGTPLPKKSTSHYIFCLNMSIPLVFLYKILTSLQVTTEYLKPIIVETIWNNVQLNKLTC